ncbi:FAD/NAD(P)-binding domain-containing protein, partial [Thozetella sp. PMI_491]
MESIDVVVVGAGVFGLAVAKTHRELSPTQSLVVLEANESLGGTWAKERLYPGLRSNNLLGTYDYPGLPMDSETFGVQPGEHVPGSVIHAYLAVYARRFGILDKIRYSVKVLTAEHADDGGWTLTLQEGNDPARRSKLFAKKLVVATGVTSKTFVPEFEGQEAFRAPLFHSNDLLKHADTLDTCQSVTVLGGMKSGWDSVYAYASKGVKVDWVIRESGHGPAWMAPPFVTPLKKWLEKLVHTRMLTWFSPCVWGAADGYAGIRGFFHGTAVGRAITNTFWSIHGNDVLTLNQYCAHPETKKLVPWSPPMFTASSFSIMNYPTNFFDLVRNGTVKIHIADITHLSAGTVHLSDGTALKTDALCCGTGWKKLPSIKFLPEGIEKELGMPHAPEPDSLLNPHTAEEVDKEILAQFPRLQDQPEQNRKQKPLVDSQGLTTIETAPSAPLSPFTLYHFIVPPSAKFPQARDIAFAGVVANFTTTIIAQVQAIWIHAFFHDQLPVSVMPPVDPSRATQETKTLEEVRHETALHSRFGKWRYPCGYGSVYPDFVFDAVPYVDLLLGDLGLKVHRKGSWLAEATEPYGPEDYKVIVEEWKTKV